VKKLFVLLSLFALMTAGAFAGSSSITLTAPQLTAWNLGAADSLIPAATKAAAIATVNTQLTSVFSTLQNDLNTNYFSKLHDLNDLSKGFANANAAAFDNASLLSFQTYDLFGAMIGFNVGAAVPSTDANKIASTLTDITSKGDAYIGLATGGFAGQLGINTSLFLVKDLYLSAKFGMIPSYNTTVGSGEGQVDVNFKQTMFGLGVNYTLFPQVDLGFGFIKWRGLSVGSGLVYNSNTTDVTLRIADQKTTSSFSSGLPSSVSGVPISSAYTNPSVTATVKNIKAKLIIDNSSVVLPIELMTSIQALWLVNVGFGVGVDVNFPSSTIKLGGASDLALSGLSGATFSPASAVVVGTDSKSGGDMLVPRIAASLGMNVAIFKLEVPLSYYPTTKALAFGISTGVVW